MSADPKDLIAAAMVLVNKAQTALFEASKALGVNAKPPLYPIAKKNGEVVLYDSPCHKPPCECFSDEDLVRIIRVDRVLGKGTGSKVDAMTDSDLVTYIRDHFGKRNVSGHIVTVWLRHEHQRLTVGVA